MAKAGVSQLTYADLQALPDDHNRYELIDGELLVSPATNTAHQWAVSRLLLLLHAACPAGHGVLTAPFDWLVDELNVFEPDVLVDPASPSVTVLERVAGRYRDVAHGHGDTPVTVARPFPLSLAPSDLLR